MRSSKRERWIGEAVVLCVLAVAFAACGGETSAGEGSMKITSAAFDEGGRIPSKYTCDSEDLIPPLQFEGIPGNAASLALIVDDPDAPGGLWDHWVVFNIPAATREVREGQSPQGVVGKNSWGKLAWGGPCPPSGEHRYVFRLFALDQMLPLTGKAGRSEIASAMEGHVVGSAELIGRYRRAAR